MRAGIADELRELAEAGRLRRRPLIDGANDRVISVRTDGKRRKLVNWSSNDYLGLSQNRAVKNAAARALRTFGAGSGASRLMSGGLSCHRRLEQRLAQWLGTADALVTTTGFQANLAALASLANQADDVIIIDRACHASTYDGAKISAVPLMRFKHNDLGELEKQLKHSEGARRRVVCVESIYSMDGDEAPLVEVERLCKNHGALLVVDEAHALGVLGPGGRGLCHELGVKPDLVIGTCSKSLGAQGGFLAGDSDLIELAVNRGRSFIFSTAPAPAAVGAAVGALDRLRDEPELSGKLLESAAEVRVGLRTQGWNVPEGRSPIIPVIVGDEKPTLELSARLAALGHYAPAVRPPTVPAGSCRLRLTVTLSHKVSDRRRLIAAMGKLR
jgi:8-amino-7-oxononanoate synthase